MVHHPTQTPLQHDRKMHFNKTSSSSNGCFSSREFSCSHSAHVHVSSKPAPPKCHGCVSSGLSPRLAPSLSLHTQRVGPPRARIRERLCLIPTASTPYPRTPRLTRIVMSLPLRVRDGMIMTARIRQSRTTSKRQHHRYERSYQAQAFASQRTTMLGPIKWAMSTSNRSLIESTWTPPISKSM